MREPLIEICVEGIDGLAAAQAGGADRVELCASLVEGGLTPSIGVIRAALGIATVPFHVIVRPRGGDFLYSEREYETMLADVAALRELRVPGVVVGCLTADGRIDEERMTALVEAARPCGHLPPRVRHDPRPREAIEAGSLRGRPGVDLRSKGHGDRGLDVLKRTVAAAAGRIKIMACGELDETNISRVWNESGADELHFAALATIAGGMDFRNPHVGMGGTALEREYQLTLTDPAAVRRTIAAVRQA